MTRYVIKQNATREIADGNVSGDYIRALNEKVKELIKRSSERAEKNNRVTLMEKDL